jgi:hypothetical protein
MTNGLRITYKLLDKPATVANLAIAIGSSYHPLKSFLILVVAEENIGFAYKTFQIVIS